MIQSPISRTGITTTLQDVVTFSSELSVVGVQSFFAGDIIKVREELMTVTVDSVTNNISVLRAQLGTVLASAPAPSTEVRKMVGNYNIVNNNINFVATNFRLVRSLSILSVVILS